MKWSRALAPILLVGVAACDLIGVGEPVCDICTLTARVHGVVQSSDGTAVPGATVTLRPLYSSPGSAGSCGGEGSPQDSATAATDAAGVFDATIGGLSIDGPRCVEIAVTPDSGSNLAPRVDSIRAEFVLPGETPPRTDVTVTLEAR